MAAYKYSMVFNYVSGGATGTWSRIPGGWSEGFYWDTILSATDRALLRLLRARAALLPQFCAMTGLRVQRVDPSGPAALRKLFLVGPDNADNAQDIPQMAAFVTFTGVGVTNVVRKRFAAIPDRCSVRGEWSPPPAYRIAMTNLLREYHGWKFRGRNLTETKRLVATIGADGTYLLLEDMIVAVGSTVSVNSTINGFKETVSGKFKIDTYTNSKQGKLRNWTGGACTLGSMTPFTVIYPAIVSSSIDQNTIDMVTRKIGRPSKKYVGRRSRKAG